LEVAGVIQFTLYVFTSFVYGLGGIDNADIVGVSSDGDNHRKKQDKHKSVFELGSVTVDERFYLKHDEERD